MTTFLATILPGILALSIIHNDQEVAHVSHVISGEDYDALQSGRMTSDAFPVNGWSLMEMECDGIYRHGFASQMEVQP